MDAVGLVSSCVALAEVALGLTSQIKKLRRRYKDAPQLLESLETQLDLLTKNLKPIQVQAEAQRFSIERAQALRGIVDATEKEVRSLYQEFARIDGSNSTKTWDKAIIAFKRLSFEDHIETGVKTIQQYTASLVLHNSTVSVELGIDILDHVERLGRAPSPMIQQSSNPEMVHQAAREGDIASLRSLLNIGANVNVFDDKGRRPLHTAALHDQKEMVQFLCRNEAKLDVEDDDGRTPLHVALLQGHLEIAQALMKRGASTTIPDSTGKTPDDFAKENLLLFWNLRNGPGVKGCDPQNGNTILIAAAIQGDSDIVRSLLQEGADVNAENRMQSTALIEACMRGHKDVIAVLLDAGADVNKADASNYSAFTRTIWALQEEAMRQLLETGKVDIHTRKTQRRHTAIAEAVSHHQWTMMEALIQHGANVNDADWEGCPIFCRLVSWCQDPKVINFLIDQGADPALPNRFGHNAMQIAVMEKRFSSIETLLKRGADPKGTIDSYPYLCWLMKERADWQYLELLIAHGADINGTNRDGWSALRESVLHSQIVQMRRLLAAGAEPHNIGAVGSHMHNGSTILMLAVSTDYIHCPETIAAELISHGARVNDQDSAGWTALHWAIYAGLDHAACAILVRGADLHIKANDGMTPIDDARESPEQMKQFLSLAKAMQDLPSSCPAQI